MRRLLVPLMASALVFVGCSDDESNEADTVDSTLSTETTPVESTPPAESIDPATVKVYTSEEVCALAGPDVASATLGVELTAVNTSDMSTPQCSYEFTTADGTFTNLTVAVQRPIEDLGGLAGQAGFDYTTSLVIFDTPYEALPGLGDQAAISASETFTMIAVLANDQVFTIATSASLDIDALVAFGNEVAANV